jgi:outer membrane protein assembly factor BamB
MSAIITARETSMRSILLVIALPLLSSLVVAAAEPESEADRYWPGWRGPRRTGEAPLADPPLVWSEQLNVAWKAEIPGKGSATPIVWGETVFVLTAVPTGDPVAPPEETGATEERRGPRGIVPTRVQQFTILALGRDDGRVLWQKVLREQLPHEGTHPTGTWASPSPVTDGERVYAFFGSYGLYCLDLAGQLLWETDLGDLQTRLAFGEGSSPALHDGTLVVNWDHEGESFIVALDKMTGREIWRRDRDERTSWSTPLVVEHGGRRQVITSATHRVRSYDLESGELIWQAGGMTVNVIPTPVASGRTVILTSGFRGNALLAVNLDGAWGDITASDAIVWTLDRDTPYTPSPLLYGDHLYFLKSNDGILSSYEVRTGEKKFGPVRLDKVPNVYASPLGAADRVYVVGRDGATVVVAHGDRFQLLAENELDDGFDASPVAVDSELYLRGRHFLYRISEPR